MIFRTKAQKEDQALSWNRCDRAFFAAGACHVLTHEFLRRDDAAGFRPFMITPESGFRGTHVFASDGNLVFDYHGYSNHTKFITHYFQKISRLFPGWRGSVTDVSSDFWSDAWFERTKHRKPTQYFADPAERANAFIERFNRRRLV